MIGMKEMYSCCRGTTIHFFHANHIYFLAELNIIIITNIID